LNTAERARGALLGLACGDAIGTTVEFRERGTFPPLQDMMGGGPFDLLPGQWTNLGDDSDTTAAVCGQIAGAFYGESGIPSRWLGLLHDGALIRTWATELSQAAP
jgi:ADP-ribosylglycohydrolase